MAVECTCSACSSFACPLKQRTRCMYGKRKPNRTYLYFNKTNQNVSTSSPNDFTFESNISKNEIDESLDENYDKSKDTSVASCGTSSTDRHDNFYSVPFFPNTLKQSAAKLSAQVMNIPFQDLEVPLSKCDTPPKNIVSRLSPFDILEKIKEVYKACTCKVCECIIGKSQINEMCKCKPCECDNCNNDKKNTMTSNTFRSTDVTQIGTNSIKLGSRLFKGFAKHNLKQDCSCKPFDCAECAKSMSEPWSCEQCRCKAQYSRNKYQKVVVATVESDNQSHQGVCNPCQCAECSHQYGLSSSLHHEISTEINRPDGCHCEACLNDTCLPDGVNACNCERRNRVIRKPVQRDTNYGIHRSIVSRQNTCTQDLIAMFAATSKIYPECQERRNCNCNKCECLYCDYKDDSCTIKSNNETSTCGNVKHRSPPLNRDYLPMKSSLNTNNTPPGLYTERPPDIKAISKFSSHCRCIPCEFIKPDNMRATCKGDICDCTQRKCKQCVSKDEVVYPSKKGKLTPTIYKNKINKSFCDEKNRINVDYKKSLQKACLASLHRRDESISSKAGLVDVCDEHSQINYVNIEPRYLKKDSTKIHLVDPFLDSSNTSRGFTENNAMRFQASSSRMVPDYSSIIYMGSESIPQSECKYQSERSIAAYVNNTYLDSDLDKNNNFPSRNIADNLNITVNDHKPTKDVFNMSTITNKPSNKDSKRRPKDVKDDEHFFKNANIDLINEPEQYIALERKNLNHNVDLEKQDILSSSKSKEKSAEECKRSVHYSKSVEKAIDKKIIEKPEHLAENNVNLDEDYIRVQKTIKDSRAFSLHLMKLLENYERANREFDGVYSKLAHSNKTQIDGIPQRFSCAFNENVILKSYDKDHTTKNSSFMPTKNIKYYFDTVQNHRKDNKMNQHIYESIQSLTDGVNFMSNNRSITEFIQQRSKHIEDENSIKADDKIAYIEPEKKMISSESNFNSSCNDNVVIEIKQDTSDTSSFNHSDNIDEPINHEDILVPILEANTTISASSHFSSKTRNIKRKLTDTKIPTPTTIASKRRKTFIPVIGKSVTLNKLCNPIIVNNQQCNNLAIDDESNLMPTLSGSVMDENVQMSTDNSYISINTRNINNSEKPPKIPYEEVVEHKDLVMIKSPVKTEHSHTKKTCGRKTGPTDSEVPVHELSKHRLEKGLLEAVIAIKQASMTWEDDFAKAHDSKKCHENEALMRLHSEVKKLLELPLLQKCDVQTDAQYTESQQEKTVHKASLRVGYLTVHKLSDSTIAVKWRVPKVLESVQGYEVLINGCVVQKIPDKSCNESMVLSGLPRADKVLVTVRTVTAPADVDGHSPTATVIYRPKCELRLNNL